MKRLLPAIAIAAMLFGATALAQDKAPVASTNDTTANEPPKGADPAYPLSDSDTAASKETNASKSETEKPGNPPAEAAPAADPRTEAPKADMPKADTSKADAPKADTRSKSATQPEKPSVTHKGKKKHHRRHRSGGRMAGHRTF